MLDMLNPTHGGDRRRLAQISGLPADKILDFSANINPLGFPSWLRSLLSAQVCELVHYPDPLCTELVAAASRRYGVSTEEVVAGNGTAELLSVLPRAAGKRRALIPVPSYVDYARSAQLAGLDVEFLPLSRENGFDIDFLAVEKKLHGDEIFYIGRPNNPTGRVFSGDELRDLAARCPETCFVVDEAFGDFVGGFDSMTMRRSANVWVLLSLTKTFAVPGLRVGCAVCPIGGAEKMKEVLPPWNVGTLAQAVGKAALEDAGFVMETQAYVSAARETFLSVLGEFSGIEVFEGAANFLLVRLLDAGADAALLARQMLREGIAIRVCSDFVGLGKEYFRIAVRREEENERFCEVLGKFLNRKTPVVSVRRKKAAAIMFQGTGSDVGKSVLTAALCRILREDGFRVAPFKSQNMALNSFVTHDGFEMGRAQVLQAKACGLEPDVRMNPVLLKPNSDIGSQVIVMGKPIGSMDVGAFIKFKPEAFAAAKAAFDSLSEENDVVVIEGAGSPAEVNLKKHDIVNMAMAHYAEAPVLLVGDIDRGGVYAALAGTMELLDERDRGRVAGFVINRFRGDETLLAEAHEYLEHRTGRPVLGVIPHLEKINLPEEDSVSFKRGRQSVRPAGETLEIVVVDLSHISNFTDLDALCGEPDVWLRVVRPGEAIGCPDALILPGSKNVAHDLRELEWCGMVSEIVALAREGGTEIVGICGGYQMLGERIYDPHCIETGEKSQRDAGGSSVGLLPLTTVMEKEKTLRRAEARHCESGHLLEGYEIHHGRSTFTGECEPVVVDASGDVIGAGRGLVWGSYLHGLFDADEFRRWWLDRLRVRGGLKPIGRVVAPYDVQKSLDSLARVVRGRLDMKKIYSLLNI